VAKQSVIGALVLAAIFSFLGGRELQSLDVDNIHGRCSLIIIYLSVSELR